MPAPIVMPALMMHNPNTLRPLPEEPWDRPQLVARGELMEWTDGAQV